MGQARIKNIRANKFSAMPLMFDYTAPGFVISSGDRSQLVGPGDELKLVPRAVRLLLVQLTAAAFPSGVSRNDRKIWSVWQRTMDDNGPVTVELSALHIDWVRGILLQDTLKLPVGLSQWAEALLEYVTGVLAPAEDAAAQTEDP